MRCHRAAKWAALALPLFLEACSVVEIAFDVPCRIRDTVGGDSGVMRERIARVWLVQDRGIAWDGGYYFWCDTLLWPIDAGASVVYWYSDAGDPRVRTRWPGPLGWIARLGAVVLPGVSARRRDCDLEWSILGLGASPSTSIEGEGLDIVGDSGDLGVVKDALVARLMDNTDSLVWQDRGGVGLRACVMARIVDLEWIEP